MGFFKDTNDSNFVHHEIKTYQRRGDQVRSEYERLNPDGSVTKTIAYGDAKEGLKYRTFHLNVDGTVKEIPPESYSPRAVAPAPATQPRVEPPPPPPQPKVEAKPEQPRKAFAFIVEPKEADDQSPGVWRVRTLNLNPPPQAQPQPQPAQKRVEPPAPAPAAPAPAAPKPWWYDPFKEMIAEGIKREEKIEKPVLEDKKPRNLFNLFDDDVFFRRPFNNSLFRRPRIFDALEDGRSLANDFFNGPLLPDF